ncbi:MAG TPA: aminotransferase class I/II-fold pyridoxal phosphate-dependent enzyme, partial [Polyangiaceae bacterium]
YAIAPAPIIDYMNRIRAPFNVTTVGQAAATAALDDRAHVAKSAALNAKESARVCAALGKLGVKTAPTQANFVLADVGRPARPVYDALLRRGVIVRPFASLPTSLRVTFGLPEENDRFVAALAEVLS